MAPYGHQNDFLDKVIMSDKSIEKGESSRSTTPNAESAKPGVDGSSIAHPQAATERFHSALFDIEN